MRAKCAGIEQLMAFSKSRRGVCAESLEPRRLFSKILPIAPDASSPVKDPPARLLDPQVVMNANVTYPLSDVPQESSRPGAPATIYLDFTGDTSTTWGGLVPGTTPAYDTDGDPTTFSSTELANIQQIWEQVADTYSPFNVNVTTVNPGNTNNPNLEVVIGGSGGWTGGTYGGIAYIGSYASSTAIYGINKNKVFVFPSNLGNGYPRYVADDAEHEIGHAYGLSHQSTWSENTTVTPPVWTLTAVYNTGNGSTGPIMGNALNDTRAMFWDGTSQNPNPDGSPIIQDDLSIISSSANGFGYVPDDYGNSIAAATTLAGNTSFSANGVISTNTDTDFFSFNVFPGSTTITVTPGAPLSDPNPTLNAELQLFNSSGTLIASGTQTTLAKSITTTLTAGTYYVEVSGDGTYGDLGEYGLTITGPAPTGDRYEPNDSFSQATDFGPVVTESQSALSISAAGNGDYYSFTPVSSGALDANISFVNAAGNLDLYLYNQNQTLIGSATSTTANLQDITATVVGGQKYYLRVAGASGAINPYYTLNITAPTPTWLSNQGSLSYSFSGTSASPTLNIAAGTGLLTSDAGTILSNLNVSVTAGATLQMQSSEHFNSLQVASGASAKLLPSGSTELFVNSLQLGSTSTLDLANNSLQWNGATLSTVQGLLTSAYDSGWWNGAGITSSVAVQAKYTGLGYSSTLVPGAVFVKYTSDGDANLDGVVNADDLSLIAAGEKSGGTTWQQGDFNYDQKITSDDFLLASLALAYQG
jgi:hypothetical protein